MKNPLLPALIIVAAIACQKTEPVQTEGTPSPPVNVEATPRSDTATSAAG